MKPPAMLTRAELSHEIANRLDMTLRQGEETLETIIDAMVRGLRRDERIELRGFGVFWLHQRRGRIARNPKTGAKVDVPPKKVVHFRPSKEISRVLSGGGEDAPAQTDSDSRVMAAAGQT